mgnify:CR=1 FL=1
MFCASSGSSPKVSRVVVVEGLFHHTGSVTSWSSSRRSNVLNPLAYSNPPSPPSSRGALADPVQRVPDALRLVGAQGLDLGLQRLGDVDVGIGILGGEP